MFQWEIWKGKEQNTLQAQEIFQKTIIMNAFVTSKLFHLTRKFSTFFLMVKENITCHKRKSVLPINKMKSKPIIHTCALLLLSFGNPGGQSIPDPALAT